MPEMYLRQPEFTSSACGKFTKKKQRKNTKYYGYQRGNTLYIFRKTTLLCSQINLLRVEQLKIKICQRKN